MDTANIQAPNISLVLAKRGHGKTTLVKNLLKKIAKWSVFDPKHEYEASEFNAVLISNFQDLRYLLSNNEPRIIFRPQKRSTRQEVFEFWCACHLLESNGYILAVDEVNRFMPSSKTSKYGRLVLDEGRHDNLGMIGICRRPAGLDNLFISQTDNFFMGKVFLPADVNYFKDFLPAEMVEEMRNLKQYKFAYYCEKLDKHSITSNDLSSS